MKNCIPVDNETKSSTSRLTRDGKRISYHLNVLQQPMRARACGSGAKSSADRRPVDPPPIVELKIYQGEGTDNEITYNMHANYFLFATLEQARPIAHGRVPDDKARLTVLTGTTVAGAVYLDRPTPAGYFIFPDLSVRHEGVYRLSFSMFEGLKESKDDDNSDDSSRPSTPGDSYITHRLDVKSVPFVVFSAKRFPGLTESTSLSRMVAEQGCRVRIRREVRQRRRDAKAGGKDWESYEEETADARARVSATPDASPGYSTLPAPHSFMDPIARPRSASNTSHQSFVNPLSRRTSLQEMNQSYHQPFSAAPHTPQGTYGHSSPYGPSPSQQYSQPPFMQQQPAMQPPPPQYHSHAYPPPAMPAPIPQHSYYGYAPAPPSATIPHSHFAPTAMDSAPQPSRMSVDYSSHPHDHRRSSTQYSGPPQMAVYPPHTAAPSYQPYSQAQHAYQPSGGHPQQPMYPGPHSQPQSFGSQDSFRPPPPQPIQPPVRATGATTPLSGRSSFDHRSGPPLPPLQMSADMAKQLEPSSPLSAAPHSSYFSATSTPLDGHKRSYTTVFNDRHLTQPLRQGAQPSTPGYSQGHSYSGVMNGTTAPDDGDDQEGDLDRNSKEMNYRRADGRPITRHVPSYTGAPYAGERF
ncbi:hypothetical protein LTR08_003090 [Meristemomyces frigidus]|nr:hypothetical protein LTR08_003090 [Meristemomyces frigidus]